MTDQEKFSEILDKCDKVADKHPEAFVSINNGFKKAMKELNKKNRLLTITHYFAMFGFLFTGFIDAEDIYFFTLMGCFLVTCFFMLKLARFKSKMHGAYLINIGRIEMSLVMSEKIEEFVKNATVKE